MIKPFKILSSQHVEAEGITNVHFEVTKAVRSSDKGFTTHKMQTMLSVPDGEDIDMFLFRALEDSGWV